MSLLFAVDLHSGLPCFSSAPAGRPPRGRAHPKGRGEGDALAAVQGLDANRESAASMGSSFSLARVSANAFLAPSRFV